MSYNHAMQKVNKLSVKDVAHIASLANLPVTDEEKEKIANGFNDVLSVIDKLFKVNVKDVEPTHQVTDLENVFREDVIDDERMLSQEEALSNAKRKHNGYFVVDQILETKNEA